MQQKTPPAYQALEDIKKARELLGEGPHRWTKHFYARTKEGGYSCYDNKDAYCFCAQGAIRDLVCLEIALSCLEKRHNT